MILLIQSFRTIGDSYVSQSMPSNNYGKSPILLLGHFPNLNVNYKSVLQFNILNLSPSIILWTTEEELKKCIVRAVIRVYIDKKNMLNNTVIPPEQIICRLIGDFNEELINWNNEKYEGNLEISQNIDTSTIKDYIDINIKSILIQMILSHRSSFAIEVRPSNNFNALLSLVSRNQPSIEICPSLIIDYNENLGALSTSTLNEIYLPPGKVFTQTQPVYLNRDLTIIGVKDSNGQPITNISSLIIRVPEAYKDISITLKNLVVYGPGGEAGLVIDREVKGGKDFLDNLRVQDNMFGIYCSNNNDIEISDSCLEDNNFGLVLQSVDNADIKGTFEDNSKVGIYIIGGSDIKVKSNFIKNPEIISDSIAMAFEEDLEGKAPIISEVTGCSFSGFPTGKLINYHYTPSIPENFAGVRVNTEEELRKEIANPFQQINGVESSIILGKAGIYDVSDLGTITRGIIIKANGVVLKNITIDADIVVDVGEYGTATIENATLLNGHEVRIRSGGMNTVYLINVRVFILQINCVCRVVIRNNSNINTINIRADVKIDEYNEATGPIVEVFDATVSSISVFAELTHIILAADSQVAVVYAYAPGLVVSGEGHTVIITDPSVVEYRVTIGVAAWSIMVIIIEAVVTRQVSGNQDYYYDYDEYDNSGGSGILYIDKTYFIQIVPSLNPGDTVQFNVYYSYKE